MAKYAVRYLIVDVVGDIIWQGSSSINAEAPLPLGENPTTDALTHVRTAQVLRASCDTMGAPAGRVLITFMTRIDGEV